MTPTGAIADGTDDIPVPLPQNFSIKRTTVAELKKILKDHGIPYLSGIKKAEAIELVKTRVLPKVARAESAPAAESSKRNRTLSKKYQETNTPAAKSPGKNAATNETQAEQPSSKKDSNERTRTAGQKPRQPGESEVEDDDSRRIMDGIALHGEDPTQLTSAKTGGFDDTSTTSLAYHNGNLPGSLFSVQDSLAIVASRLTLAEQLKWIEQQQKSLRQTYNLTPAGEHQDRLTKRFGDLASEHFRLTMLLDQENSGSVPNNQSQMSPQNSDFVQTQQNDCFLQSHQYPQMSDTKWNQDGVLDDQDFSAQQDIKFANDDNLGMSSMQ
jgi:hypothetical protein